MIITCKKHIPFHWLLVTILPWASWVFVASTMGVAFLFSLKKFLENPAGLTFVMSLPGFISIVSGPTVSFISDRIWTRYGRRKPFVVTAWTLCTGCCILMPIMPNFWLLLLAFMLFNIGSDLQSTQEPLKQEIIPPAQRGRAVAGVSWMTNLGILMFYAVAIGRFDDRQFYLGIPLTGEQSIYWAASVGMIVMTLLICLSIKEIDPKSKLLGEKFNLKNFFRSIMSHNLWPVYLLVFGATMLGSGLGVIGTLIYTEQWHFTKQEMGNNIAIGTSINLVIIIVLGYFADRLNRIRAYQVLIILSLLLTAGFYSYVNFILYDRRPSLLEVVIFGEMLSVVGWLTSMVYTPLVYDYVPRNEMGTFMAGSNLLQRLTFLVTLNGVGFFVWLYSSLFLAAGGDMTRVIFRESLPQKEVTALLAKSQWHDPSTGQIRSSKAVTAEPWYDNGAVLSFGRCYEIRFSDPGSVSLKKERDNLEEKRSKTASQEASLRDQSRLLQNREARSREVESILAQAENLKAQQQLLAVKIGKLDETLQCRGENLARQANTNLAGFLLPPGEQIRHAAFVSATVVELATSDRIPTAKLERTLERLRQDNTNVIDLRPVKTESGYGVVVSLAGKTDDETIKLVIKDLCSASHILLPGEFSETQLPRTKRAARCLELDLTTIEDPLTTHLSPVARAVNWCSGWFNLSAGPDRRVSAIGRSLREPGSTEHVCVRSLPCYDERDHAICVRAVFENTPTDSVVTVDSVTLRLQSLLTGSNPLEIAQARTFYDRVVAASAEQRVTVAAPGQESGFAPMKYDYMAGYLWMLMLGLIGFWITLIFLARERRGLIRKRGVEAAAAQ